MADRSRSELFDETFLARLQQLHLVAKRLTTRGGRGARRSRRLGDGLEFADHRSYTAGDDIRFIDWPYYARMEKLLLRLFHERSEADVVILLDVSASMAPGGACEKFDCARRIAAALAFVAMGGLERVIVQPFSREPHAAFRTGRNRGQILEVLDFLAALEPAERTDLRRCVDRLVGQGDRAATVLLLSDLLDCAEDLSDCLVRLRGRGHDTTVLHVCWPMDASPAFGGAMLLRHAETGQTMALNVTDAVRESYRQRWQRFRVGLERTTLARGATYVAAETDVPVERFVLRILRQAGVLAG